MAETEPPVGREESDEAREGSDRRKLRAGQAMAVAWNMGWPIAAGLIFGAWIDGALGSSPVATLLCTLGALVASVRWLIALTKREDDVS